MFKKEVKISAQNLISGKDRKNIIKQISNLFNQQIVEKIFRKNEKINQLKVKSKKTVIYTNDDYPLFVDATDKGDFLPTVHCLLAYPDLLPKIIINPGVEEFIYKGASLMWPGVLADQNLGEYKAQDLKVIVNSEGKYIAIGEMVADHQEYTADSKGEACFILTWKGDKLWEFFKIDDIEEVKDQQEDEASEEEVDMGNFGMGNKQQQQEESSDEEPTGEVDLMANLKSKNKKNQKKIAATKDKKEDDFEDDFQDKKKGKKKKPQTKKEETKEVKETKETKEEVKEQQQDGIPVHQMDQYVKEAFLNALKLSINDKQLPIDSSQVYATHMMQCKQPEISIDIKNTSWKKIAKFFTVMQKEGYIDYKEPKKNTQAMISKIHRNFNLLSNYEPTIYEIQKKQKEEEKGGKKGAVTSVKLNQIEELFKAKKEVKLIFGEQQEDIYFTQAELKNKFNEYVKTLKSEKKNFLPDELLKNLRPQVQEESSEEEKNSEEEKKVTVKKINTDAETLSKENIWKIVEKYIQFYYKIIPAVKDAKKKLKIYSGKFKGVKIITEKVHNKNVTKISGLEAFGLNLESLQQTWTKQYSCSVSSHEIPGIYHIIGAKKNDQEKEKEIHIQGNFLIEVQDNIMNDYQVPEKYITTQDKLTKKKEKRMG